MREPDATFSDRRQAVLYDVFNNDRSDLEAYVTIAYEVEAHRVVESAAGPVLSLSGSPNSDSQSPALTLLEPLWTLPGPSQTPIS